MGDRAGRCAGRPNYEDRGSSAGEEDELKEREEAIARAAEAAKKATPTAAGAAAGSMLSTELVVVDKHVVFKAIKEVAEVVKQGAAQKQPGEFVECEIHGWIVAAFRRPPTADGLQPSPSLSIKPPVPPDGRRPTRKRSLEEVKEVLGLKAARLQRPLQLPAPSPPALSLPIPLLLPPRVEQLDDDDEEEEEDAEELEEEEEDDSEDEEEEVSDEQNVAVDDDDDDDDDDDNDDGT